MILKFILPSGRIVVLGSFLELDKEMLKMYVREHPIHWIVLS